MSELTWHLKKVSAVVHILPPLAMAMPLLSLALTMTAYALECEPVTQYCGPEFSSTPVPFPAPMGAVTTLQVSGDILYAGGHFLDVRTSNGEMVARSNAVALNMETGEILDWAPATMREVTSISLCDSKVIIADRKSSNAGTLGSLRAFSPDTGESLWTSLPNGGIGVNGAILCTVVVNNTLFVGGEFSNIDGQEIVGLAAVDVRNAAISQGPAVVDGAVLAMARQDQSLYIGGRFNQANGTPRTGLAAIDLQTGSLQDWAPQVEGSITSMAWQDETLYFGRSLPASAAILPPLLGRVTANAQVQWVGEITGTGKTTYQQCGPGDPIFGCPHYDPPAIFTIVAVEGVLHVGGFFESAGGVAHAGVASVNEAGISSGWNPALDESVGPRPMVIHEGKIFVGGSSLQVYPLAGGFSSPSDLRLVGVDDTSAVLAWGDNSTSEQGFHLYGGPELSEPPLVDITGKNVSYASVHGLTPNTAYKYFVKAFDGTVETYASNVVRFVTLASPPTYGENIVSNLEPGRNNPLGTALMLFNPWGFGAGADGGSPYRVNGFEYYWDPSETTCTYLHTCTWDNGALMFTPTAAGTWWIKLRSLNQDGAASERITLGPFLFQEGSPAEGEVEGSEGAEAGAEAELTPPLLHHSADTDADGAVALSELLRVIQLYTRNIYSCAGEFNTEDGYIPVSTEDHTCSPHDSDYDPQDWRISLSELMRLVQLYNNGSYTPCEAAEDGYCLGVGEGPGGA